jgi:hypothetical protein
VFQFISFGAATPHGHLNPADRGTERDNFHVIDIEWRGVVTLHESQSRISVSDYFLLSGIN